MALDKPMLSAHLMVEDLRRWETVSAEARTLLHDRYGIKRVTLQPEPMRHAIRMTMRSEASRKTGDQP